MNLPFLAEPCERGTHLQEFLWRGIQSMADDHALFQQQRWELDRDDRGPFTSSLN